MMGRMQEPDTPVRAALELLDGWMVCVGEEVLGDVEVTCQATHSPGRAMIWGKSGHGAGSVVRNHALNIESNIVGKDFT
jgi:hypothetical protein